jgi:hypothetical protein
MSKKIAVVGKVENGQMTHALYKAILLEEGMTPEQAEVIDSDIKAHGFDIKNFGEKQTREACAQFRTIKPEWFTKSVEVPESAPMTFERHEQILFEEGLSPFRAKQSVKLLNKKWWKCLIGAPPLSNIPWG